MSVPISLAVPDVLILEMMMHLGLQLGMCYSRMFSCRSLRGRDEPHFPVHSEWMGLH